MDQEEHDGADTHVNFHCVQDAADINASVTLFDDVLRSLKSSNDVRDNELLHEMYEVTFPGMQQKLVMMIDSYSEEDVIAGLLILYDKMEDIMNQYAKRIAEGAPLPDEKPPRLTTSTTTTFMTTTTKTTKVITTTTTSETTLANKSIKIADRYTSDDDDSDSLDELLLDVRNDLRKEKLTSIELKSGTERTNEEIQPVAVIQGEYRIPTEPGECPICCEDEVPPQDLFIFDRCGHQYCKECLCGYYDNLINDNKVLDITCPFPKCEVHVEYHQVQDVVTPEQFARYEEFVFLASLNADPNVRWCPKVGCGNAIIGDPANSKCECTNPDCKYEFCFQCSEPWHQDYTCEQYQEWKVENGLVDKKFSKWAQANTKKCPSCRALIEKMSGCNHMTCYKCKYEFCWLCNGKYTSSHFDVFNVLGCPGMQSGNKQFGMFKRVGMRALIGTGLVLGGIIGTALALPAAVVAGPIYGGYKLHQHRIRKRRRSYYLPR